MLTFSQTMGSPWTNILIYVVAGPNSNDAVRGHKSLLMEATTTAKYKIQQYLPIESYIFAFS